MWHTVEICQRTDQTGSENVPVSDSLPLSLSLDGIACQGESLLPQLSSDNHVEDLRWYLEYFIPRDSFDIQKANWMTSYLKDISEQLRLHVGLPLLRQLFRGADDAERTERTFNIEINVRQTSKQQGQRIQNIYWELLEDPELWLPVNVNAIVRRLVVPQLDVVAEQSLNQPLQGDGHTAQSDINVLLVLARDYSEDSEDAQTDLAYQHLLNAKSQLEKTSNVRHLNLKIVRPGSFPAFKNHLESVSVEYGRGFYDIVHFDLHGRVAKRKGIKESFLYFASSAADSKKLTPISSKAVAEVLASHGSQIAVLNACDSARSGLETDANLAEVFVSTGVVNVLAMSHRLLESAANSFVKAFYHAFLIKVQPFSTAAASARAVLRTNPMRMTRFRSSEPLLDWLIPVVYSSGKDMVLANFVESAFTTKHQMPALDDEEKMTEELVDRGGDILRVDRLVVEHSCIMILGSPGVGKSALVDQLCSLWTQTSSFGLIIHINVREQNVRSRADLVERIAASILTHDYPAGTAQLTLRGSKPKEKDAAVLSEIQRKPTILIFDGIRDGHHNLPLKGWPPYLPPTAISELCGFINEAISPAVGHHTQTRVVLITRHDADFLWRNRLEAVDSVATLHVSNLSLADAFDLATKVFVECDVAVPTWYRKDADALEQILLLCDLNPLSIRHVVTALAGNLKIGFNTLLMNSISLPFLVYAASDSKGYSTHYMTLHDLENGGFEEGPFRQSKSNSFLFEMHKVWESMHRPLQLALCFLGLYWHSGPIITEWIQMMMDWGICDQIEGLRKVVQIVGNRLWIESEDQIRITYIHPLLTMFLRDRLCEQDSVWEKEDIGEQAFAAFLTFRCMLTDREPTGYFQEAILHGYVNSISSRLIFPYLSDDENGMMSAESPPSGLHTELYNFLYVCGLCTSENLHIAPSKWPKDGFTIFFKYVLKTEESVHYRRKCVEAVEQLLSCLENQYDQILDDPQIVFFWIECMSFLLDIYGSKIPTFPEKVISKLSTISTFIGGLDQIIFDHFIQEKLLFGGDLCHHTALYLADNDAEDAEIVKDQATSFYHRALQRVIKGPNKQKELLRNSEEGQPSGSLNIENANSHWPAVHTGGNEHPGLGEAEINLLLEVRELEWQIVQQKSTRSTDLNGKLEELREQLSSLLADLSKNSKLTVASVNKQPGSSKQSASTESSKINSAQKNPLSNLASAYDDTDILSAAVNHYQLSTRSWSDGKVEDTARHLARLNELIRGDQNLEKKFPLLEQYTQTVATATRAQDLAESIESTAKASDFLSMEENWNEAYALLGATPSPAILELQEAYRDMMKMQLDCPRATEILVGLDPPQPRWEMRERTSQKGDFSTPSDIRTEDQAIIDTAWLRSCTDAVVAVEKGEYHEAIGHIEIMESLQSGDLVTWHDSRPMTDTKRWLKEEDEFSILNQLAKDAVINGDLSTAFDLMEKCTELDKKLGNRHGKLLEERKQALRVTQLQESLRRAKQLGESDHFTEALITIADVEKEKDGHFQEGDYHSLNVPFENDLQLAKNQISMRFAVKEERHLDAAHYAQQCISLLQQTPENEMPPLRLPKLKLVQTCAALQERSMIRYHQVELASILESNEDVDEAIKHLDALIAIGENIDAYHPPEWLQVREDLEMLQTQRESLKARNL